MWASSAIPVRGCSPPSFFKRASFRKQTTAAVLHYAQEWRLTAPCCTAGTGGAEGQVRWRDQNTVRRLEVFHSGFWGSICSAGWDNRDARTWCLAESNLFGKASAVKGDDHSLAWWSSLGCTGSEASLAACSKPGWGVPSCGGSYAGTQCLSEEQMCSPACLASGCLTCDAITNLLDPKCTRKKPVNTACGRSGRGKCDAYGQCQYGAGGGMHVACVVLLQCSWLYC